MQESPPREAEVQHDDKDDEDDVDKVFSRHSFAYRLTLGW